VILYGSEESKKKYPAPLTDGEGLCSYCLSEPDAGARPGRAGQGRAGQGRAGHLGLPACGVMTGIPGDRRPKRLVC